MIGVAIMTARFGRYEVHFDDSLDNTVVVDGIPVIDKSKLEKLLSKIAKEFNKKGTSIKVDDIFVPWDDTRGRAKGECTWGCSVNSDRFSQLCLH